jgi:hypothetical protein
MVHTVQFTQYRWKRKNGASCSPFIPAAAKEYLEKKTIERKVKGRLQEPVSERDMS